MYATNNYENFKKKLNTMFLAGKQPRWASIKNENTGFKTWFVASTKEMNRELKRRGMQHLIRSDYPE